MSGDLTRLCLYILLSNQYLSPEHDSNLGLSRIAVFEDCKATALTTQPPWLDPVVVLFSAEAVVVLINYCLINYKKFKIKGQVHINQIKNEKGYNPPGS